MGVLLAGLAFAVFLAAAWLTGRIRHYALERQLLDVPNARSSHAVPTPRGGGMAIVVTTLVGLLALGLLDYVSWPHIAGLLGGGALVAGIGFADDHRHVAPRWRLLTHFAAAVWALIWLGGLPPLEVLGTVRGLGWLGHAIAVVYVVWLLNLTNFMDGIDGITGIEAITVLLGGVCVNLLVVQDNLAWSVPLVLAAATLGFLVWNWPPARIFMGDAGSGFLGFMMAALSIQAGWVSPTLFWSWIILLGVYVIDTTVTLLRRVIRRERVYEAHRMHAYQHAAGRWRHKPVTAAVAAINLCWLAPIAVLVARGRLEPLAGVLLAYIPLITAAFSLKAGLPQGSSPPARAPHV